MHPLVLHFMNMMAQVILIKWTVSEGKISSKNLTRIKIYCLQSFRVSEPSKHVIKQIKHLFKKGRHENLSGRFDINFTFNYTGNEGRCTKLVKLSKHLL